jgi:hypothetical protein
MTDNFIILKEGIAKLPTAIKDQEIILLNISQSLDKIRKDKKTCELDATASVSNATDPNGKKIYPNAEAREVAFHYQLSGQEKYRELLDEERRKDEQRAFSIIEIDYLKREFKSIELLLKALEIEK